MKLIKVLTPLLLLSVFINSCKKDDVNKVPLADAGVSQSIQLPTNSAIVTGTGSDADGKVVGYLWSEVSGPNAVTIVNPGSPTT